MPTLSRPPGLLARRPVAVAALLLATCTMGVGCAGQRGALGTGASGMKTFLAVGDKPLPVVSGEAGSTLAADVPPARPSVASRRGDAAISGRVYDEFGRPVPGAVVRLAVGPAPGGRDNRATTDASGGFTLRDLRPNATYTLIAEWDGGDGLVTGRARASADETGVRISLAPDETSVGALTARPGRVSRVSEVGPSRPPRSEEFDRGPAPARPSEPPARATDRGRSVVNEEDLPPAPDGDLSMDNGGISVGPVTRASARPRIGSWQPSGGIRRVSVPSAESAEEDPATVADEGSRPRLAGGRGVWEGDSSDFDEGPNPLPPAVERRPDPPRQPEPRRRRTETLSDFDAGRTPFESIPARPSEPDRADDRDTGSDFESPRHATLPPRSRRVEEEPRIVEDDGPAPGALVAVPQSYAPLVLDDRPFEEPSPATRGTGPGTGRGSIVPPAPPRPGGRRDLDVPRPAAPRRPTPLDDPFDEPTTERRGASGRAAPRDEDAADGEAGLPDWATPRGALLAPAEANAPLPSIAEAEPDRTRSEPIVTPLGSARPVRPPLHRPPGPEPTGPDSSTRVVTETRGPRRPTWGEVTANVTRMPPVEGQPRAKPDRTAAVDPNTRPTGLREEVATGSSKAVATGASKAVEPSCDYDERLRRVMDFRLPGLDGKPVRFKDLDADLVLLDFWGTWCQPCVRSIPHLTELQKRLGEKRLVVVGIACEQDAPETSAARVATVAGRLKVNYPILLSRNDGSCPLQEALRIHAFPTMVLLDRQGRVLWRDQGATPATLARLDRMIATATEAGSETARR